MPYGHIKQYRDLVKEAQKKRIQVTKEQQKEIRRIYAELVDDLSSRLSRHSDKTLTYRWLKDYAKELKRESKGVYQTVRNLTEKNMLKTANAVTDAERSFWGGIMPELSERFSDVFSSIPKDAVDELLSGGIYKDFSGLSERIWNYRKKFDRDIQYIINQGIVSKKPAYDLAKDLEIYLDPKAKKPFDWSRVYPGVHKSVDYNAQRLARTAVTHAYQMSFQRSTKDNPFIEKYKWLSSNGGRTCELCRQRDGRLFEKDELPLDHPNGMCTVAAVIPKSYEEIAEELADWVNNGENMSISQWVGANLESDTALDKIRRKAKGKLYGEKLISYQELPKSIKDQYENGLKRANEHCRRVLEHFVEKVDYAVDGNKKSSYNKAKNRICINPNTDISTIAHELFHKADQGIAEKYHFYEALQEDYVDLLRRADDDVLRYITQHFPGVLTYDITGEACISEKYRGISDILDGVTNKSVSLGFGHQQSYWNSNKMNLPREAWAQFGRILYINDPQVIEMMKDLFPKFTLQAVKALKGLAK